MNFSSSVRKRIFSPAIQYADEALKEAGLDSFPEGITPHSLRRTFVSALAALGKDPRYVMGQVGHSTPHFTFSVYAQIMRSGEGDRERLRLLVDEGASLYDLITHRRKGRSSADTEPAGIDAGDDLSQIRPQTG